MKKPNVYGAIDEKTNTISYLVIDPATKMAAIVDPVLDFDGASGRTGTDRAAAILALAESKGARIQWILETHAHADHLSAAPFLKAKTGASVVIGAGITTVQKAFKPIFNLTDLREDGSQFDHLVDDGDVLDLGDLSIEVIATPGHTPACVTYRIGDAAFVGDTLFMPDYGTARTDFPGGDAAALYRSIQRILALPPETRLFVCHDYRPAGRTSFAWETTVADQRASNIHVHDGISEDAFVSMRMARDATLALPTLLVPSIQVNIDAGALPKPEANGVRYLKVPMDVL